MGRRTAPLLTPLVTRREQRRTRLGRLTDHRITGSEGPATTYPTCSCSQRRARRSAHPFYWGGEVGTLSVVAPYSPVSLLSHGRRARPTACRSTYIQVCRCAGVQVCKRPAACRPRLNRFGSYLTTAPWPMAHGKRFVAAIERLAACRLPPAARRRRRPSLFTRVAAVLYAIMPATQVTGRRVRITGVVVDAYHGCRCWVQERTRAAFVLTVPPLRVAGATPVALMSEAGGGGVVCFSFPIRASRASRDPAVDLCTLIFLSVASDGGAGTGSCSSSCSLSRGADGEGDRRTRESCGACWWGPCCTLRACWRRRPTDMAVWEDPGAQAPPHPLHASPSARARLQRCRLCSVSVAHSAGALFALRRHGRGICGAAAATRCARMVVATDPSGGCRKNAGRSDLQPLHLP